MNSMQRPLSNLYQYGIRIDGISFLNPNCSNRAGNFGHDFGFHLHGFQNNNNLTDGDSVSLLNLYVKNRTGHRADYGTGGTGSCGRC